MKSLSNVLIATAAAIAFVAADALCADPSAAVPVSIAPFAGNRSAAISYTFDDGLRDQLTLAVPMLDEVGFKGTFFVIAGRTASTPEEGEAKKENGNPRNLWGGISWPELKKLSDDGHEIGSHTWTHPALTKLSGDALDEQFTKADDAIKEHTGQSPLTVAFPGNSSNADVRATALKYYIAFRENQQSTSGKSTTASLNAWADKLVHEKKWGVLMTHGIAAGYVAMSDPDLFHQHLKYVKSCESEIWVDTFANISKYTQERAKASIESKPIPSGVELN